MQQNDEKQKTLLTTREAAAILTVSPQFLERDRWSGPQIPFIRIGERAIRYRHSTLQEYIKANECGINE